MFLFYEVVEYLQNQPHDDKAAEADKAEVRSVVTPLFPDTIEFADVHDESFEESQLAVAVNFRGSLSLMSALTHCLPNALYSSASGSLDERLFEPAKYFTDRPKRRPKTAFRFQDKIGIVADTMIDKDTVAALQRFKSKGAGKVIIASVFTSPEELEKIYAAHPDVEIFAASIADARGLIGSI